MDAATPHTLDLPVCEAEDDYDGADDFEGEDPFGDDADADDEDDEVVPGDHS